MTKKNVNTAPTYFKRKQYRVPRKESERYYGYSIPLDDTDGIVEGIIDDDEY